MQSSYSFLDFVCALVGPTGFVELSQGQGYAEEGMQFAPNEDKNVMQIGADGRGQHSLVGNDSGTLTLNLQKTSPVNAQLMAMYNIQKASAKLWGKNVITAGNTALGDLFTFQQCAFKRVPDLSNQKEAGFHVWTFDVVKATVVLGIPL